MPWRTATVVEERARFVIEAGQSFLSFSELCRRYGISRPTGYKWLERYREEGLEGLKDRSHRPDTCPHATPPEVVVRIVELRKRRGWGARKLHRVLERELESPPCPDTIHQILKRKGLVRKRKPRRKRTHPGEPISAMDRPNAVWTADFKREFRTGNGRVCYPLTVQDGHSRFLLDCKGFRSTAQDRTIRRFRRLFKRYGLPDRIRTDNGRPFASNTLQGISKLSVWWIKLCIFPERIEPGKPQQNGRHERMQRTLKARTARPPKASLRAQQRAFDQFRRLYNEERPHEALQQETPASVYEPSERPYSENPSTPTYPGHFEVRRAAGDETIKWNDRKVFVSLLLMREDVGLEEVGDGVWAVYFGPVQLGWLDERDYRIMDVRGQLRNR